MHCSTIFKVVKEPHCNIFENISDSDERVVRSLIIDIVLATDMAKHFDLVGKFKAKVVSSGVITFDTADQRNEIMKILIKASDVGHAAKCKNLHFEWSDLVCEEFFIQGDMEKKLGLPVSMYCDRKSTNIAKSQIGFIKNIVMPIYESINICFSSMSIKEMCLDQLEINIAAWETTSKTRVKTEINRLPKSFSSKGKKTVISNKSIEN